MLHSYKGPQKLDVEGPTRLGALRLNHTTKGQLGDLATFTKCAEPDPALHAILEGLGPSQVV